MARLPGFSRAATGSARADGADLFVGGRSWPANGPGVRTGDLYAPYPSVYRKLLLQSSQGSHTLCLLDHGE